jgi:hypothetical protein
MFIGKWISPRADTYRHTVERVARQAKKTEVDVAELAIALTRENAEAGESRRAHVGIRFSRNEGVPVLERAAGGQGAGPLGVGSLGASFIRLTCYLGGMAGISLGVALPLGKDLGLLQPGPRGCRLPPCSSFCWAPANSPWPW